MRKDNPELYWDAIISYIKSDYCKKLHKTYSEAEGWLYLSDWMGIRYKISSTDSLNRLMEVIKEIERINTNRIYLKEDKKIEGI